MSVLDERIRRIAREEAATLTGADPDTEPVAAATDSELAQLRQQMKELTARIETLEKAPRRAATVRKGTGE